MRGQSCAAPVEVICLCCESGTVLGVPLERFTVSNIRAIDKALAAQLTAWPDFTEVSGVSEEERYFANHCPRCGAVQDDMYLHTEHDQPFFGISRATGSVKLTPLTGRVRLDGDESFEV